MQEQNDGRPGGTAVMQVQPGRHRTCAEDTPRPSRHRPADPAGWTDAELIAYLAALRTIALAVGVDVRWALPDDVQQELAA